MSLNFASLTSIMLLLYRWGQVFILDALSRYKAADAREAENIVERVTPRLQHANCAVVLSAVKVKFSFCVLIVVVHQLVAVASF